MDSDKFKYVLAVAEEQNLTRAAQKLYISQPSLSKYITKLEEELGVHIFNRQVTPIQLTEAGSIYIRHMTKIRMDQENMQKEMMEAAVDADNRPSYHFGMGFWRAHTWMTEIAPYFMRNFPDWNLEVHNGTESFYETQLLKNALDLGVGAFLPDNAQLVYEPLREELVYVILPRSWPEFCRLPADQATRENPLTLDAKLLTNKPMAVSTKSGTFNALAMDYLNRNGCEPQGRAIYIADGALSPHLVAAGICFAFWMNAPLLAQTLHTQATAELEKKLVFCTLGGKPLSRTISAAYNRNQTEEKLALTKLQIKKLHEVANFVPMH